MSDSSAPGVGRDAGAGPEERRRTTLHTQHRTADRDEAEQVITELYLPNRLDLSGGRRPWAWR